MSSFEESTYTLIDPSKFPCCGNPVLRFSRDLKIAESADAEVANDGRTINIDFAHAELEDAYSEVIDGNSVMACESCGVEYEITQHDAQKEGA